MSNWYKNAGIRSDESYTLDGIIYEGTISGQYYPATHDGPAEYPEVELTGAEIEDASELVNYLEWFDKPFNALVRQSVAERRNHFGDVTGVIVEMNGIRFTLSIDQNNDWNIAHAEMINSDKFIQTLPGKLAERVEQRIYEQYFEGRAG